MKDRKELNREHLERQLDAECQKRGISRNQLIKGGMGFAASVGLAGLFAACGGDDSAAPAPPAPEPVPPAPEPPAPAPAVPAPEPAPEPPPEPSPDTPVTGGRIRVAWTGEGAGESFDPGGFGGAIFGGRQMQVYDRLVEINSEMSDYEMALAETFEPNADLTEWTITLRPDVTWHDGSDFTADDVIYSIQRAANDPAHGGNIFTTFMDAAAITKMDDLTLRIPLNQPVADLRPFFFNPYGSSIQQADVTDFTNPVGTGPFMVESFEPGVSNLFVRNPNYWREGLPYVDELEFFSTDDATTRLNALLAGDIEASSELSYAVAADEINKGNIQILPSETGSVLNMLMAVDLDPFTDNRIRQAFRLMMDRSALVENVQLGFGNVANDLLGKPGMAFYNDELPQRERDIEQAQFLLKEAGAEGLSVMLEASTWGPGMLEMATIFAEQAKDAGVNVEVVNTPPDTYFAEKYMNVAFGTSSAGAYPIPIWYLLQHATGGIWNETHWEVPEFDDLLFSGLAEPDPAKAEGFYFEAQRMLHEEGGYMIWGNAAFLDGQTNNVRGWKPNSFLPSNSYRYMEWWLA
jgi:peptide/nickel transport system substrate-binding protein